MHVVFDAYGTLLDVHSAAARNEELLGPDWTVISETWRTRQLEYAWVATLTDRYETFWTLTERALDVALALAGRGDDASLREAMLDAYTELTPFDDVRPALQQLRETGETLSVLSNGDPAMLERALGAAGLRDAFDAVVSVDEARCFKPDPRAYRVAETRLGAPASEMRFVSSNPWDAAGGACFGFQSHWINRAGRPREYPGVPGVTVIDTLLAL